MAELLEVVFEGVSQNVALPLLKKIISDATFVTGAECSEEIIVWRNNHIQWDAVKVAIDYDGDISVLVSVQGWDVSGALIDSALVRLVKYQDVFDIDISFDEKDPGLCGIDVVETLFLYSRTIVEDFTFDNCYFGVEPASDEASRFFSNEKYGPLK